MAAIAFDHVDVVFGEHPERTFALLDEGLDKDQVFERTGNILGVRDATLEVERGEIFVLMGLSGSGKSTLLRCVNGLNRVSRGRVLVEDNGNTVDIGSCGRDVLRRLRMTRISMVFQQFALMPWRSIGDNVSFGLEIRGLPKGERQERVRNVLELVHLAQWIDKYPDELSGGMQQRVGLARAFATDAEILLMDEPFSALDPLIREHLQEELLDFQAKLQRTILFVSHDLDEALKIGSRIAIMEGGKVVQVGTPEEIITTPATDYVRQFVANVNPLNVLRCVSLMRDAGELPRENGRVVLDESRGCTCRLDEHGRPVDVQLDGHAVSLLCGDGERSADPVHDGMIAGTPATTMRRAIEVRHDTGCAMPILDEQGRLVGVVDTPELLAAMMRRHDAPDDSPERT